MAKTLKKVQSKKAFTMIELIFVIVVLGILAVTALPKFVDIQSDAKIAADKGTVGGIRGGIAAVRSQFLIKGNTGYKGAEGNSTLTTTGFPMHLEYNHSSGKIFKRMVGKVAVGASNAGEKGSYFGNVLDAPVDTWEKLGTFKGGASPAAMDTVTSRTIPAGQGIAYDSPATLSTAGTDVTSDLYKAMAWGYTPNDGKFRLYCQGATKTTTTDGGTECQGAVAIANEFQAPLQPKK